MNKPNIENSMLETIFPDCIYLNDEKTLTEWKQVYDKAMELGECYIKFNAGGVPYIIDMNPKKIDSVFWTETYVKIVLKNPSSEITAINGQILAISDRSIFD